MSEPNIQARLEVITGLYSDQNRADELARLYLQTENEGFDGEPGYAPSDEEVADKATGMLGETFVIAIDDNGSVLAMAGLKCMVGKPEGIVQDVATLPELRRKGLGTLVLNKLIDLTTDYGLTCLYVHPGPGSGSFYKCLGFERGHAKAPNRSWAVKDLR